jgi:hypothetical protein
MFSAVSLSDVIRAAAARAAVLTPEMAGYLLLAGIDAASRAPGSLSPQ